jgi:hypothetical protein
MAARLSMRNAAANVDMRLAGVALPTAHLDISPLILSRIKGNVFMTKLVDPLVPKMLIPI